MKKINFTLIAGAIICMALACQKEVPTPVIPDTPDTPEVKTTVITAGFDNSKTELQPDKKVFWTDGDAISVNGVSSEAIALAAPAASASFTFNAVLSDEKKAVYPASAWTSDGTVTLSATQAAGTDASFAADALPMVAYAASGNELTFHHTAAVIKLQLKKGATSDNIDYVEFSGNNDEQVSGAFTVDYATGALTSTSSAAADKTLRVSVGKALSTTDVTCVYIAVPAIDFTNGFKMKVIDVHGVTMTKRVGAANLKKGGIYPTPVDTFDADNTIKAFVKSYVNILKVWENTTGTIDLVKGENYAGGDFNYANSHYIPSGTTITVGTKTYSLPDMFETGIRSYLLVRGYNGLDRTHYGAGSISALDGGAVGMSATTVPETHSYYWGANPFNEAPGNGGFFHMTDGTYHVAKVDVLDNWAMRALNYQSGQSISNMCTYPRSPITNYTGSFSAMRALITYAFFFKYMLDNGLDKGTEVGNDVLIRSELLGKEGNF